MKLKRGLGSFWAFLYRRRVVRARMPFWRVVIEAAPRAGSWPVDAEAIVVPVYVWARTIEEAEGLASLALEEEGLETHTADAKKHPPAAAPRRMPAAVARGEYGVLLRQENEGAPRRDARI